MRSGSAKAAGIFTALGLCAHEVGAIDVPPLSVVGLFSDRGCYSRTSVTVLRVVLGRHATAGFLGALFIVFALPGFGRGTLDPFQRCLRYTTDLPDDRLDRRSLGGFPSQCSRTMRTARSRTAGDNLFDVFVAPYRSGAGASAKPGAVHVLIFRQSLDCAFLKTRPGLLSGRCWRRLRRSGGRLPPGALDRAPGFRVDSAGA